MANTGMVLEIDKENYTEADFMSKRFINAEVRNRAYINVLGAEIFIKFLAGNGINTDDIISMHSISKIVENLDIADVILPNIHIDVRTIFDEDKIFVPKSHFELEITPDIYVVLKMAKNLKDAEILGYFKPSQINKKHANDKYYFFAKEKIVPAKMLLDKISQFDETRDKKLGSPEFLRGRTLAIEYSDHNLDIEGQKEFLKLMLSDSMLRDSVAEFDNFEVLSSQVSAVLLERVEIQKQNEEKSVPGIAALTTEEILKEGINAVVEEQKAKVDEVFEQAKDVADVVTTSAEVAGAVADVVENAENSTENALPELEILNTDDLEQEVENVTKDELISDNTDLVIEEPEQSQEDSIENDLEIVEDEPTISDIDTLKEEDIVAESETQSETDDTNPEIVEDTLQQISDDDLTLDEIDEDLSLDVDIQPVEETQDSAVSDSQKEDDDVEDLIVEAPAENIEENAEEKTPEIAETLEPEMKEDELSFGNIEDELSLDEDIQLSDVDDLNIVEDDDSNQNSKDTNEDLTIVEEDVLPIEGEQVSKTDNIVEKEENLVSPIDETPELSIDENLNEPELSIQENFETLVEEPLQADVDLSENVSKPASSVDELLDNAIAAIDSAKNVEIEADKTVSDGAIKMASVAGGAISNLVEEQALRQDEPLAHKDIENLGISNCVDDDHASFAGGLSDAKRQANMLAEAQGLATITDISSLETVEQQKQDDIVHHVVDMEKMETVEQENHIEETQEMVELDKFSGVDSPTKPVEGLDDFSLQLNEAETMELPDLNSYTINDDGTSPADNMNWGNDEDIPKDDLLDLETAGMLMDEENNQPIENNNENLVDGSEFKPMSETIDLSDSSNNVEDFQELNDNDFEIAEDLSFDNSNESDNSIEFADNAENEVNNTELSVENNDENPETIDLTEKTEDSENSVQDVYFSENNLDDFFGDDEDVAITPQEEISAPKAEDKNEDLDWTQDTDFDSLQDVEIMPETVDEKPQEDELTITEAPKEFKVQENSTVISSSNFAPREISIDINTRNIQPVGAASQPINELFQEKSPVDNSGMMKNPGRLSKNSQQPPKGIAVGLGLAGLVVVLGLIFALGFGVSKFLKGQTEETPQPISDNSGDLNVPEATQNQSEAPSGQVVEMNNNTNALASTAGTKTTKKSDFVEVKKLSWEVPGAVSAEPKFQEYFQSAGKSIKSALMTDLLSVTDLAYASEMRVSVTFEQDGTFKDARIVTSSGSSQLDNIVLRTVNQTLNVLKAPHSVGSYENTTAVLKIYL